MGLSKCIVQQKLNPAPTDPMQAKIFSFFPLFLTVYFAPFPSGLVLYWTANNILTMAQQVVIMKTTVKTGNLMAKIPEEELKNNPKMVLQLMKLLNILKNIETI